MKILMLLLVLLIGCDSLKKVDDKLKFRNNSQIKLHFLMSDSYPDTVNYIPYYCSILDIAGDVDPNSEKSISSRKGWEAQIALNPSNTLMIYIYNRDSAEYYFNLTGNKCDSLIKRTDLILKRVDVTIGYLNSNNWTITYP